MPLFAPSRWLFFPLLSFSHSFPHFSFSPAFLYKREKKRTQRDIIIFPHFFFLSFFSFDSLLSRLSRLSVSRCCCNSTNAYLNHKSETFTCESSLEFYFCSWNRAVLPLPRFLPPFPTHTYIYIFFQSAWVNGASMHIPIPYVKPLLLFLSFLPCPSLFNSTCVARYTRCAILVQHVCSTWLSYVFSYQPIYLLKVYINIRHSRCLIHS